MSDLHTAIEKLCEAQGEDSYVMVHALRSALTANPRRQICGDTTEGMSFNGETPPTLLCRLPYCHTGSHRSVDGTYWSYMEGAS